MSDGDPYEAARNKERESMVRQVETLNKGKNQQYSNNQRGT